MVCYCSSRLQSRPGLNGKGEAQKVQKGGKGKSKGDGIYDICIGGCEVVSLFIFSMSHFDVPQVLSGKEREEIYDWKADRQADWQGTSKGSSKGKGKDGYGSYGKGKESGSTGYGFDSGKVKGDGKGKGRKGKERSKETGLQSLRYLEIS